ncbi:MAG: 4Fe-4S dicluster-binding protein [Candidatus Aminicenantales bacterium]
MKKETWKELTIGTINLNAGNSVVNLTGTWRSGRKPEFREEHCIQCFFCWVYCPHFAIKIEGDKVVGINYDYCTGCGLCSEECPPKEKAIIMVAEEFKLAEGRK